MDQWTDRPQADLVRYTEQLSGLIEKRSPAFIVGHIDQIVALNGLVSGFLSKIEYYERPGGERASPVAEGEDEEDAEDGGGASGGGKRKAAKGKDGAGGAASDLFNTDR